MKQFFDERVLGAREGRQGVRENRSGRARKRVGGISEGGPLSRLIFTDRISPGRG